MPITVAEMAEADYARGFEILSDSFGQVHEYINVVYPEHETAAGRKVGGERLLGFKKAQPFTTFLKAVDTETGEIVGMAKWNVFRDLVVANEGLGPDKSFWDSEDMADYANEIATRYFVERTKMLEETKGNLLSLDLLIIDPKHQRRGAGRALIQWGTDKADELDMISIVEASDLGVPAYEASGFKNIKYVTIEPPEAFTHRPRQSFHWMVRPKKSDR